jgi:hypothetical protein
MAQIADRWCSRCKTNVPAQRNSPNHVLHGILTLLVCGFWLPIWILVSINQPYHCTKCGKVTHTVAEKSLFGLMAFLGLILGVPVVGAFLGGNRNQPAPAPRVPAIVAQPKLNEPPPFEQPRVEPPRVEPEPEPETAAPVLPAERVNPDVTPPVADKAIDAAPSEVNGNAERDAAGKLKLAKSMLPKSESLGRKRLQEIVDKYPGTEAAAEAAKLLSK